MTTLSKQGYFKAILALKAQAWISFFADTTQGTIWTRKKFALGRVTAMFSNLRDATFLGEVNKALLDHFFPPRTLQTVPAILIS